MRVEFVFRGWGFEFSFYGATFVYMVWGELVFKGLSSFLGGGGDGDYF